MLALAKQCWLRASLDLPEGLPESSRCSPRLQVAMSKRGSALKCAR